MQLCMPCIQFHLSLPLVKPCTAIPLFDLTIVYTRAPNFSQCFLPNCKQHRSCLCFGNLSPHADQFGSHSKISIVARLAVCFIQSYYCYYVLAGAKSPSHLLSRPSCISLLGLLSSCRHVICQVVIIIFIFSSWVAYTQLYHHGDFTSTFLHFDRLSNTTLSLSLDSPLLTSMISTLHPCKCNVLNEFAC